MQKILFDRKNAQKIASEAGVVCNIYNQFSDRPLTKIELLSALAKAFGYSSGWAELMAVNRSERFYITFSMCVCSHVRGISRQLKKYLPSVIDTELLLVAVSFAELNVKQPNQHHKVHSVTNFESGEFVLWFTSNTNTPEKHLARSPFAALLERQGIYLKHFKKLWPELHKYLEQKYKLLPEQVLLFEQTVWWLYFDRFNADYRDNEIGQLEIHFRVPKSPSRICYEPIYFDEGVPLLETIANIFAEGLSGCPSVTHFGKDMVDEDYILGCLNHWESLPHIEKIKISLNKEHVDRFETPKLSLLKPYLTEHNEAMDTIRNRLTNMDFMQELWGFEPRFIFNVDGSKRIYQEPWLVVSDIENFVDVNKEIHQNIKNFDRSKLLFVGQMLHNYGKERFTSMLSKIP
jgi:hypothetical protein